MKIKGDFSVAFCFFISILSQTAYKSARRCSFLHRLVFRFFSYLFLLFKFPLLELAFCLFGFKESNNIRHKTSRNLLLEYSEELAVKITKLCNEYKIDSNTAFQIKKSSSSVFANITEAQYPQTLADMHSKLEIARKECAESESWLKLIFSSGAIDEVTFKPHRNLCVRIKRVLTASCITIENKLKQDK